ncbi:choline transporter [Physcia stellaris]|nr:choline transporter [Physcia stellaris]
MAMTTEARAIIVTNSVFLALAGLSVCLRLISRKRYGNSLGADDYWIVSALAFDVALVVTIIVGASIGGFGTLFENMSEETAVVFLKILYVLQFWYIIAVALVKMSVLYFYARIFRTSGMPLGIKIMMALVLGWMVSFLFATFFQVWPIRCNWVVCDPTTNYPAMYVLSSVTDVILDIAILSLPISFVRKLKMSNSKKIGVTAIFGLGIFCTIASIARLVYTVGFLQVDIVGNFAINFDTNVVNIIMWSGIEACASTVCANLPCYGALVGAAPKTASYFRSVGSSYGGSSKPYKKPSGQDGSASLEGIVTPIPSGLQTRIEGSKPNYRDPDIEMNRVHVRTTISAQSDRADNGFR